MKVKYRGTSIQGRDTYIFPYRPLEHPDLQIRVGGGGGGVGDGLENFFFALWASVGPKIRGGAAPPGPLPWIRHCRLNSKSGCFAFWGEGHVPCWYSTHLNVVFPHLIESYSVQVCHCSFNADILLDGIIPWQGFTIYTCPSKTIY